MLLSYLFSHIISNYSTAYNSRFLSIRQDNEMFFDIFDRAANEKMFYELTADGLSFWDMRKLWDDEIGRNK